MQPYYADDAVTLYHGDCLDVLARIPDSSVDSVCTDPPYGLEFMGKDWDAPWKASGAVVRDPATERGGFQDGNGGNPYSRSRIEYERGGDASIGFQQWCEQWATECLRVLKPGGYLLAFGGSRTWHRLASAIEDAGFEIRDSIAWLYGSGFPKSMDVSKAIDKRRDESADVRAVCRWLRARIDEHPAETIRTIAERFGFHPRMVEHWAARDSDSQPTVPTVEQWERLVELLDLDAEMTGEVYRLNGQKGEFGEAFNAREVTGEVKSGTPAATYAITGRDNLRRDRAHSDDAKRWQGWGTALKPAFEPIVVARKPFRGTVASNVLEHGTGALNIDACRTAHDGSGTWGNDQNPARHSSALGYAGGEVGKVSQRHDAGRWPTNVALDDTQAADLDKQSGALRIGIGRIGAGKGIAENASGIASTGRIASSYGDEGGASRFFPTFKYEAKAPGSERPTANGTAHPTVKPLDLMRWLIRLVTPPGGTVLEPFAGSGTTAEACIHEHMRCIAIEREADYLPVITARLTKPMQVGFNFEEGA